MQTRCWLAGQMWLKIVHLLTCRVLGAAVWSSAGTGRTMRSARLQADARRTAAARAGAGRRLAHLPAEYDRWPSSGTRQGRHDEHHRVIV